MLAYDMTPWLAQKLRKARFYSPTEIQQAVTEAGLDQDYLMPAYAMFVDAETFEQFCRSKQDIEKYHWWRKVISDVLFVTERDFDAAEINLMAHTKSRTSFGDALGDLFARAPIRPWEH